MTEPNDFVRDTSQRLAFDKLAHGLIGAIANAGPDEFGTLVGAT